ncbi:MAG: hypothetical protein HY706_12500 [Candidatus Hydrogenedentes bacterium]|nr:hypothetical protein [Candidatus Hydrogenedentota bacterium]
MCGIVGFTGHSIEEETLQRAVDALHHRGPDGTGIYTDKDRHVGLGHARLSIIDLATGEQPLYSEDKDLVLVCNGEIYDFERIREDLTSRGHRLFEMARRIPDQLKIHNGVEKYILREAFRDEVTGEVYRREKWPFSAPPLWIRKGYSEKLDQLLDQYLSREAVETASLFNYQTVRRLRWLATLLFFDCQLKRALNVVLVMILTVQILHQLFIQDFETTLQLKAK